jgi:hypothetical protein
MSHNHDTVFSIDSIEKRNFQDDTAQSTRDRRDGHIKARNRSRNYPRSTLHSPSQLSPETNQITTGSNRMTIILARTLCLKTRRMRDRTRAEPVFDKD